LQVSKRPWIFAHRITLPLVLRGSLPHLHNRVHYAGQMRTQKILIRIRIVCSVGNLFALYGLRTLLLHYLLFDYFSGTIKIYKLETVLLASLTPVLVFVLILLHG